MSSKKILIGIVFIFGILLFGSLVSANYVRSAPQYTMPGFSYTAGFSGGGFALDDKKMCEAGQDFILQVQPLGCTPSVVRSDLLEEQNVAVFCPVSAVKLNPLIEVEAIDTIRFTGEYPKDVARVGFHPAQAALGTRGDLNTPVESNVGYAVIVLRRNPDEFSMPEVVKGNLTATIRYDIENAFGVGRVSYNLPQLDDNEWEEGYKRYGFWDGRGFLKLEGIEGDTARVSLYSGETVASGRWSGKKKLTSDLILQKGQLSNEIYLPTFDYCLGGLKLRLDEIENPETRVRLSVNDDVYELTQGQKFLDERCKVSKITKQGINKEVELKCNTDEGIEKLELNINPKVNLEIAGNLGSYEIGDYLYRGDEGKYVYLGYVSTEGFTGDVSDLNTYLFSFPDYKGEKLDDGEILSIKRFVSFLQREDSAARADIVDGGINVLKTYGALFNVLGRKLVKGSDFRGIEYGEGKSFRGTKVFVNGLTNVEQDFDSEEINENYDSAIEDYEEVLQSYANIKDEDEENFGEKALIKEIELSNSVGKRESALELCEEFFNKYPESDMLPEICDKNSVKVFSQELYSNTIVVNGEAKIVSLDNVFEPSADEFSSEIYITSPSGETYPVVLTKEEIHYLNDEKTEYIQLVDLEPDRAEVNVKLEADSFLKKIGSAFVSERKFLDKDIAEDMGGSKYSFLVGDVNLKKTAKISVVPNINYASTEADFEFQVGIEKRAIDLSPEKINKKLDRLDKQIKRWEGISEGLGTSVKAMKTACLATGVGITAKNFIANMKGKGVARQKVMRGKGGWYEKCENAVALGKLDGEIVDYKSVDDCLIKNSDAVDGQVSDVYEIIEEQNERMNEFEESDEYVVSSKLLQEKILDTDKITKDYSLEVVQSLKATGKSSIKDPYSEDEIEVSEIEVLLSDEGYEEGNYDLTDLKDIELYSKLLVENPESDLAKAELHSVLKDIQVNSDSFNDRNTFAGSFNNVAPNDVSWLLSDESSRALCYEGLVFSDLGLSIKGVDGDEPVGIVRTPNGEKYIVILEYTGNSIYPIRSVYDVGGNLVENPPAFFDEIHFVRCDDYQNNYNNPIARYYESGPYKGYPAIIPFDKEGGWYAATKAVLPVGGNVRAYDESGRVNSYWICNVGPNGIEEFDQMNDDNCQMINLGTGQPYNTFSGLESGEAKEVIDVGVQAIYDAQQQYPKLSQQTLGAKKFVVVRNLKGNKWNVEVGQPAVNVPGVECADFMSPKECKLLFNVCDPVICPASRCDFGGAYPVSDPVQSGIIGSLALCLPNFKAFGGEVYVPVCLSGLHAGVDGWIAVKESYRDCLQENLETGRTVGICDQIHSIYMCEFLWRQGIPLVKVGVPKVISLLLGQNVRGGGEYLGVQNAWQTASESMNFFTQSYASNSYKAFKARSVEEAGGTICKAYSSIAYPNAMDFLDALTEPDSPSQFHGRFEEIPYTTATNPPVSQYKVFYHIYAGNDRGSYYRVYLKGSPSSTYFQDTAYSKIVDSGYVPTGDYESQSVDFTAPSGYDEMCIVVNGQEECGFKEVSTSFAQNYITDEYVNQQASQKDISSEAECISGTPSFYSLLDSGLNVQETAGDFADPEIYNKGITRICATENPGIGTDPNAAKNGSRWVQVGYCGDKKIKCWLDTESVKDVIDSPNLREFAKSGGENIEGLADDSLQGLGKHYSDILLSEEDYLSEEEFKSTIDNIKDNTEKTPGVQIAKINNIIDKVFWDKQKAKLLFLRGNAHGVLALNAYKISLTKRLVDENSGDTYELRCESGEMRNKIIETAQSFVDSGKIPGELGCSSEYDNDESIFSCYDGVKSIYAEAGANPYGVWYDRQDLTFENSYFKNYKWKNENNKEIRKRLDNYKEYSGKHVFSVIRKGDMLEVYSDTSPTRGHNVIFKEWKDEQQRIAFVYSFPGGNNKKFELKSYDLLDEHPVKLIWSPCFRVEISEKDVLLEEILKNQESLPFIGQEVGGCSGYVSRLYLNLFGDKVSWVNAWCRHLEDYGDRVWYLFDVDNDAEDKLVAINEEIQSVGVNSLSETRTDFYRLRDDGIQMLSNLEEQGKLKPGMIVGVYWPGSAYNPGASSKNPEDDRLSCGEGTGKKSKVRYTHNLIYLGRDNLDRLIFAEHFGSKAIQKRTLGEFEGDNLIPVVVVSIREDVKSTEQIPLVKSNIQIEKKKLNNIEQGLEDINNLISELQFKGENLEDVYYLTNSKLRVLVNDLVEEEVFESVIEYKIKEDEEKSGVTITEAESELVKGNYCFSETSGSGFTSSVSEKCFENKATFNILEIRKILEEKQLGTSETLEEFEKVDSSFKRLDRLIDDINEINGQIGYRMYYTCNLNDRSDANWGCAEFKTIINRKICSNEGPLFKKSWWEIWKDDKCKKIEKGEMNLIEVRKAIAEREGYLALEPKSSLNLNLAILEVKKGFPELEDEIIENMYLLNSLRESDVISTSEYQLLNKQELTMKYLLNILEIKDKSENAGLSGCDDEVDSLKCSLAVLESPFVQQDYFDVDVFIQYYVSKEVFSGEVASRLESNKNDLSVMKGIIADSI